ncbi:hypothetical protein LB535_13750 [Mesorhizobium sp. CA10]|uniref:hypothetical protein n=1 Tax=Mesorhizobium sp. CA10 TaxID=588495 RepID=UPI001CCF18D8|nr:hypothetical protein [Mesorhizobium sp. CA10]MBZ9883419.1 hypothetical protein [Mesorhizobium sp. CA10]
MAMRVSANLQRLPTASANIAHRTNFDVEELTGRKRETGTFVPLAILAMLQIRIAGRSLP